MAQFVCRPAEPHDSPEIHRIFAHYVSTTVISFYYNPPSVSAIESKRQISVSRGLPYIVVENSASTRTPTFTSNPSLSSPSSEQNVSGSILGYAYASPFRAPLLAYSPSVEVSIFVHPEHLHHGIGSVLMDSLLKLLKSAKHCAFEPGYDGGCHDQREIEIRNIFAIMAHDINGPDGGESGKRLIEWYEKFGFEIVGRLKKVGWKEGRWIDTVYLQLVLIS